MKGFAFHDRAPVFLGGVELACLTALAWWPGTAMPSPGLPLFFGAFLAYVAAGLFTASGRISPSPLVIWGIAVLLRLALLPSAPELSDDVYRYLWDGHVQLEGVNPYLHAPSDADLAPLRTDWHGLINNPDIPTIYPPLAQGAFLLIALIGGGILQAKLLWLALDLATGVVLARVARETGRDPLPVLVLYLWSPLLVVETAWSAHLEVLGLLAVSLVLLLRTRPAWAGAAAAGAALVKLAPAAALPPLARRLGVRFVAAFSVVAIVSYLPYVTAGPALWEGLFTYARDWRFMTGPFALVEAVFPGRWPPRIAAGAVIAWVIGWLTLKRSGPERSLFWILGTGLILSPTVHPWYVLWILPFAVLRRSGPWILLSGLVFLGYWGLGAFQDTGTWPQPLWLRLVVWLPPLAWLALRGVLPFAPTGPEGQPGDAHGEVAATEEQ